MTSTTNISTNISTTEDPCPWWCTSHYSVAGGDDEKDIGVHHRWLAWNRPEMAPQNALLTTKLTVSQAVGEFNGETMDWAPGMSLTVFDSVPAGISPEVARKLAAALIEGAEIVESYLTARCASVTARSSPRKPTGVYRARSAQERHACRGSSERATRWQDDDDHDRPRPPVEHA